MSNSTVEITSGLWYSQDVSGQFSVDRDFEVAEDSKRDGYIWVTVDSKVKKLHVWASDIIKVVQTAEDKLEEFEMMKKDISRRFSVLERLGNGVVDGRIRSMIVGGAPGIGKSYTLENLLKTASNNGKINYRTVRGNASPLGLYIALFETSAPGSVLVLDDLDSALNDDVTLNILKGALDTTGDRRISWMSMNSYFKENDIPQEFSYAGSVIFISNIDFNSAIQKDNKIAPHLRALIDRSTYMDLKIHTTDQIMARIYSIVESGELGKDLNISDDLLMDAINWMEDNRDHMRPVSIRTVVELVDYIKMDPIDWKDIAEMVLLK